jgi:hypothetical protein
MKYLIGWNLEACIKALEWMKSSMACLPVLVWKLKFHPGVMLGQHLNNIIGHLIYYAS